MKKQQTITVKGQSDPCRVTMGAMVRYKRASGQDVSEIGTKDVSDLVLFMWCCVASACKADDVASDLSFEDFADALEPDALGVFLGTMQGDEKKSPQTA